MSGVGGPGRSPTRADDKLQLGSFSAGTMVVDSTSLTSAGGQDVWVYYAVRWVLGWHGLGSVVAPLTDPTGACL
jgi:hypothetical protein